MKLGVVFVGAGLGVAAALVGQLRAGGVPAPPTARSGNTEGVCTSSTGPDVIVSDLNSISRYGPVGEITGYAIGTTSCNIGGTNLLWDADSPNHPVIAQNLYRLKDGRFEQIGMGWLKHGFTALTLNLCNCGCNGVGGLALGVGCSDPYGAGLNGSQSGFNCGGNVCGGLGPRSEVNAALGIFAYPYGAAGVSGSTIYKRIQVQNGDVDPALNPGAVYFSEGQYVTPDDAQSNNHNNNASYETMIVGAPSGGGWALSNSGATNRAPQAV